MESTSRGLRDRYSSLAISSASRSTTPIDRPSSATSRRTWRTCDLRGRSPLAHTSLRVVAEASRPLRSSVPARARLRRNQGYYKAPVSAAEFERSLARNRGSGGARDGGREGRYGGTLFPLFVYRAGCGRLVARYASPPRPGATAACRTVVGKRPLETRSAPIVFTSKPSAVSV